MFAFLVAGRIGYFQRSITAGLTFQHAILRSPEGHSAQMSTIVAAAKALCADGHRNEACRTCWCALVATNACPSGWDNERGHFRSEKVYRLSDKVQATTSGV